MGLFNDDKAHEAMEQENELHEKYRSELLVKHGVSTTLTDHGLEKQGFKVDHIIEKNKDGEPVHTWKLYKLVDSSPRYKVKRVIAVEDEL